MKRFGLTTTPFFVAPGKVDIPEGDPRELTNMTDQFANSAYGELFNILSKQCITPAATTASDLNQLNRAITSIQLGSNLYTDTGTAQAKLLTHKSGSNFLYKTSNVLQNAFCLRFVNSVASNGTPVTITIFDAANAQNLPSVTNIPFVKSDGSEFLASELAAGDVVDCFYDSSISKFKTLLKAGQTVQYFSSPPTANVGASIFVEGQGYMHWGGSAYAPDQFTVEVTNKKAYYTWDYSLSKYRVSISILYQVTSANVLQSVTYGVTLSATPTPNVLITPINDAATPSRAVLHATVSTAAVSIASTSIGFVDILVIGEAT